VENWRPELWRGQHEVQMQYCRQHKLYGNREINSIKNKFWEEFVAYFSIIYVFDMPSKKKFSVPMRNEVSKTT
jgi:hypothetical protein